MIQTSIMTILYEDNDILVCIKPAGIATESANIRNADMVSMVKSHLGVAPYVGLIHRLDQPVSGILVFAKNPAAAANLSKQVQTDDMQKYYTAIVEGNVLDIDHSLPYINVNSVGSITVTNYLIKDNRQNKAMVVDRRRKDFNGKPAKEASLTLEVISYNSEDNTSTLRIHLLTGRFHQIRAQLSNLGHPIVGDTKYDALTNLSGIDEEKRPSCLKNNEKGIALCASELSFKHPRTQLYLSYSI